MPIVRYIVRRLAIALLVLFGISLIVFTVINLQPGNPYATMFSPQADAATREELLRKVGYYDPIWLKYVKWLGRAVQGDLGYSIQLGLPVSAVIASRVGNTLVLTLAAAVIAFVIALPVGIYSAIRRGRVSDRVITIVTFGIMSIPAFFLAMILIRLFSAQLKILPSSGIITPGFTGSSWDVTVDVIKHLVMPATVLAALSFATYSRYIRSSVSEILDTDYVRALFAKGVSRRKVLGKHVMKNAAKPIITVLTLAVPGLLSGALITETVFSWPGLGRLGYEAAVGRDYPLLMGITLLLAVATLLANLLADVLYIVVDPRIRVQS
ncbi:peptide ABC transporter permease [Bifidobacterium ramosum]|uniref:Peptide ABC transporter permease n=1 Tax=Bifidobacterium ramosum TaxID=1798158 RepID=A0A6L4WZV2_9BIFI|nr:ABC transporter permease [Bifidobacterium ramosum]KAB8287763.1 peptide ABC transporter permease [Bifidobacterium ramosum]